jgi:hypothetical protein
MRNKCLNAPFHSTSLRTSENTTEHNNEYHNVKTEKINTWSLVEGIQVFRQKARRKGYWGDHDIGGG